MRIFAESRDRTGPSAAIRTPVGQHMIRIDIRNAKNIKKDILRRVLTIPYSMYPHMMPEAAAACLLEWYASAEPEDCLGVGSVDEFNNYLRPFETLVLDRTFTSYTFRRFAFARFIGSCTDTDGVTDWDRACAFSLHMKVDTLRAFYLGPVVEE